MFSKPKIDPRTIGLMYARSCTKLKINKIQVKCRKLCFDRYTQSSYAPSLGECPLLMKLASNNITHTVLTVFKWMGKKVQCSANGFFPMQSFEQRPIQWKWLFFIRFWIQSCYYQCKHWSRTIGEGRSIPFDEKTFRKNKVLFSSNSIWNDKRWQHLFLPLATNLCANFTLLLSAACMQFIGIANTKTVKRTYTHTHNRPSDTVVTANCVYTVLTI